MSDATARGFLDDVLANPEDDAPRLIFADWLKDNGQPDRAEFIRAQVERARLPEWDARHVRLLLREKALLEQHEKQWRSEVRTIRGAVWGSFRRGFLGEVTFTSFKTLASHAAACRASAPVEAARVRWPRKAEPCESLGPIAGLRELVITGRLVASGDTGRLAASPLLSTLRALTIDGAYMGVDGFRRVLTSPHLENLTALRLPRNLIGNGGIEVLEEAATVSLDELDLSEENVYGRYGEDPVIDTNGMRRLADWKGLARLRSLSLSGNDVRGGGLRSLLESPHATSLKRLVLRNTGLNAEAFATARSAVKLDVLDLGENWLLDSGINHLAKAPCIGELKVLRLDRCELGASAGGKLAKAPFLASLRSLAVDHNSFGQKGLSALLRAKPPELHTLSLSYNNLGDPGASALAKSATSNGLLVADLRWNAIDTEGALALAGSAHLRDLLVLLLRGNPINKRTASALAKSPLGKRLAVLDLSKADSGGNEDDDSQF